MSFTDIAIVVSFIASALAFWLKSQKARPPYPPGPKREFLIGNLREMKPENPWLWYHELAKEYGDVTYLNVLGQHIVILNNLKTIQDFVVKKASIYSDRPKFQMAGELVGFSKSLILSPTGPKFVLMRRLMHHFLNKNAVAESYPNIELENRLLAKRLLDGTENFSEDVRLTIKKLILGRTYGFEIHDAEDKYAVAAEDINLTFQAAAQPGRWLVDNFPSLKYVPAWFPGAGFQRQAKIWREKVHRAMSDPVEQVKAEMAKGTAPHSFVSHVLESKENIDDEALKWLSGNIYAAGSDTTIATLQVFVLAMALHPDIQAKAQRELDEVVGTDRLPGLQDRPNLKYLECVIKEVIRWEPMVPLALPYRSIEDYVYNGYFIPKNSIVMANNWSIMKDENLYPEPDRFWPERFEKEDVLDPHAYVFGCGRRVCPGMQYGMSTVWMAMVSILVSMNIRKPLDKNGKEYVPTPEFRGDIVRGATDFDVIFEPRSAAAAGLIHGFADSQ